jgi:predicted nucleic acid-binding protein
MAKAGFEIVEIEGTTAENIAATRATTDLKMPDAIVLAIAQDVNGTLVSADKALVSKAKSSKVKVMTPWSKL